MRDSVIAVLSGTLFGAGLALSGMMDPQRVRGFLDIFGAWDPTLAFVMGGAIFVMALAWLVQKTLAKPLAAPSFSLPDTSRIDAKLIVGAAIFGIGWGVAGLCPGPGIAALAINPTGALVFGVSLLGGMALHSALSSRTTKA